MERILADSLHRQFRIRAIFLDFFDFFVFDFLDFLAFIAFFVFFVSFGFLFHRAGFIPIDANIDGLVFTGGRVGYVHRGLGRRRREFVGRGLL